MALLTDLLFKSPATGVAAMVIAPFAGAVSANWYSNVLSGRADLLIPPLQAEVRELGALDYDVQKYCKAFSMAAEPQTGTLLAQYVMQLMSRALALATQSLVCAMRMRLAFHRALRLQI